MEGIFPNLSDYAAVKAAFDGVVEKYGSIDILVNNAGVSESTPFTEYTDETFEKVMDLNVKGVYNCSKAASEHMIAAGSGVILNTSSMVSRDGQPAGIAYPTSKFAVNGFYPVSGERAGTEGHPGQRGCAGHHLHGYDETGAQRGDRSHDRADTAAENGTAGGYRQRFRVSCIGQGVLHQRRGAACGRSDENLMNPDIK